MVTSWSMEFNPMINPTSSEAKDLIAQYKEIVKSQEKIHATPAELDRATRSVRMAGRSNPYFKIEIDPKLAKAHYNLGIVLYDQKKLDEAIACFRRVIQLDPKYAYAYNNLGTALYDQKKLDEAIACFKRAIGTSNEVSKYVGPMHIEECKALAQRFCR